MDVGEKPMNEIPLIDWNGNGKIDSNDIALSLLYQIRIDRKNEINNRSKCNAGGNAK